MYENIQYCRTTIQLSLTMSYTMHHVTDIATWVITAPVVGPQYGNPYMNGREMCCLLLSSLQPLSTVQCLQVVKVGHKTLRNFNSANVQVSQIW